MQYRADDTALRRGRVLVLGTDQRVVLAMVRSLGRQGLTVHVGWCAPNSVAIRSRYVAKVHYIPPYTPDDDCWKDILLSVLARESFDLVIPCNDSTLVPLVANRADFAAYPQILIQPDELFSVVSDKFNTYQLAVSQGVNVPRGRVIDGSVDPDDIIDEFGLPLVLKPQSTFTVKNTGTSNVVQKVRTRAELHDALKELGTKRVLVQENFVGRGVGLEMLVHEGTLLFAFQHARIHETVEWGSSYRRSVEITPEFLDAAKRLMRAIRYTGVAMAEFIVDPNSSRWVFLEINGRFWGSLPLAVEAAGDFPYYLYQMAVEGQREFPSNYRRNVRCRNLTLDWGWLKSRYRDKGWRKILLPFELVGQLISIVVHRDHLDCFSLDDPLPQWFELRELFRQGWAKVIRSVVRRPTETAPTIVTDQESDSAVVEIVRSAL